METLLGGTYFNALKALKRICFLSSVDCAPYTQRTYNGGLCGLSDVEIDSRRIANAVGEGKAIQKVFTTAKCFNATAFIEEIRPFFIPTPTMNISYRLGTYVGFTDIVEYLAIAIPNVNTGLLEMDFLAAQSNPDQVFNIDASGSPISLESASRQFTMDRCQVNPAYVVNEFHFTGCETLIDTYVSPDRSIVSGRPNTLMTSLAAQIPAWVDTLDWGIESVCETHERYCNSSEHRQFTDKAECIRFMTALPKISPACGLPLTNSGNSSVCRVKHHFMAPIDPIHCFHLGYGDRVDPHGMFKCNDEIECYPGSPMAGDPSLIPSLTSLKYFELCKAYKNLTYSGYRVPVVCTSIGVRQGINLVLLACFVVLQLL
jgi:hypothetical protein